MENPLNTLLQHLMNQSLQITILVVIVAVVTCALRKRSAHLRYLLWLVVLAKCLLLPVIHVGCAGHARAAGTGHVGTRGNAGCCG